MNLIRAGPNREISRRLFLGGMGSVALGGSVLSGLSWPLIPGGTEDLPAAPARSPLIVKPILTYETPTPRPETSWRNWGEIHSESLVGEEMGRIRLELETLQSEADFPLNVLPLSAVARVKDVHRLDDSAKADVVLVYAAGGWTDLLEAVSELAENVIFFVRYRSGPVYLWYEIIHPRFLRDHSDHPARQGIDFDDVVVDSQKEIAWRLRGLCGLKNTVGSRIIAVGGAGGWSKGGAEAPRLAAERWGFQIETLPYPELGRLIEGANRDEKALQRARRRAETYLNDAAVSMETKREYAERCFLLDEIFRTLMARYDCRALTINECMGTIMQASKTAACLTLSTLNDSGYLAFCESDFVAIPAGVLLASIAGRPSFLHNPTFPHEGVITLAHCTAPRRMDGSSLEPVRVVTHFESDFGAAPKVEFRKGQRVTIVNADFAAEEWLGFTGEIADTPYFPICRSQLDVRLECNEKALISSMRGFHWMLVYGDYLREVAYALKRTAVGWRQLT